MAREDEENVTSHNRKFNEGAYGGETYFRGPQENTASAYHDRTMSNDIHRYANREPIYQLAD